MDTIERSQAARHKASRTVARARFTDDLRLAHRDGAHGNDGSGYWAEVGCPGCCGE